MPTLTRYILIEVSKTFLATIFGLTLLMLIVGVFREAMKQGLAATQILQLMPYILPSALQFTMPAAVLFAVCVVFGRISADNEIVAIKSVGISPMTFVWPIIILTTLLSLATVVLNDLAAFWGRNGARRVVIEGVEEIAYGMLKTHGSYSSDKFSINVKSVQGRTLIQPTIMFSASDDAGRITVRAEEAELSLNLSEKLLVLVCRNGTADLDDKGSLEFDRLERTLPLEAASRAKDASMMPSWMPLRAIPKAIEENEATKQRVEQMLAAKAAFQMLGGNFNSLLSHEWRSEALMLESVYGHHSRLQLEPQRRWANGFCCLCFMMVGAPMAVRLRNADFWSSFFLTFLPILVVYYPMLVTFVDMVKTCRAPAFSVWTGNVALVLWGSWILRRVLRY